MALGLSSCSRVQDLFGPHQAAFEALTRVPTYCEVCFWKCAAWAYRNEAGNIVKLEGIDNDSHCNGRLCPRGTGGLGMYTDEDRLMNPLIRVEENGKQTYREASWDEALDLIASKWKEQIATHGPETMALFKHGSSGAHFQTLFKAMGAPLYSSPSYAQCRGPREEAFFATFGAGVGSPEPTDIRDTRCLVLIGSHIGENMHNGQVQEMADAIDRGADIITVDPRFSTAASKSSHWLPIKPATDIALLMAWIHVIINEGWYDKEYVEKYTTGFELLKQHVAPMTPEWAYGITTIKPEAIRETARVMSAAAPATIIHPGRHVTWYGDDTQRSRAIAILNALLGTWGRKGGFYFHENVDIPALDHPPYPKARWGWRDLVGDKFPMAQSSVSNALVEASIYGNVDEEKRIRSWMVSGTNLPQTMPNKELFQKAVNDLDFIVVVDTMPMEITGYADVVLPECTYLERYDDLRNAPHREPSIAVRVPAAEPKGESKPASWMAKELGKRMGVGDFFPYEEYSEVLDKQLKMIGSSLDEMKKIGVKNFERKDPYLYMPKGAAWAFATPSGKIELYSSEMEKHGFDPIPNYKEHPQPPAGFYRLIYGRAPAHTFSRTANNPHLSDLMKENALWVNPKVAKLWGLKAGQKVWMKNQDDVVSTFPIKVRVTERIRWDSVYMVHGFGHQRKELTRAYGRGASDTQMITNVMVDPTMGGTGMRGNFVTFLLEEPKENSEI
ncbi:MAG TPA: molybdopterin-dependent oxidoreductase [Saprospiraceae bacterium]|nr:molybdopterin-dependent oxidoreductase [Saprospiraceae bacterium]